jgi:UDP-glucose 4-epimerase
MQVLVTGGAGFIGSHVCRTLHASGGANRIIVLDDLSTGTTSNLAGLEDIELVEGSILNEDLVTTLVAETDAVVHLAAVPAVARSMKDPRASHDANATGTVVVLEAARRHGAHVIVASSSSVYGRGVTMPTPEDHPTRPASPYAASKLATESYGLAYARSFGLPVLVFRFFNVFGPFQRADHAYAAVIPAFVNAALAGRPLTIHGDGTQTRDFTYVGDVTTLIADALKRTVTADSPVNLAFGSRTSLLSLVSELESLLGRAATKRHGPLRPGDVHDSQADSTLLRSLFPAIAPTPLRAGLQATVEWFSAVDDGGETAGDEGGPRPQATVSA